MKLNISISYTGTPRTYYRGTNNIDEPLLIKHRRLLPSKNHVTGKWE